MGALQKTEDRRQKVNSLKLVTKSNLNRDLNDKSIDVLKGEVKLAKKGESLSALLGSCVGIIFVWKERNICGLAHCTLPESKEMNFKSRAKYVDEGIRSLKSLMKIKEKDIPNIEVVIVGGGNMINSSRDENDLVGVRNLKSAREHLAKCGFRIKSEVSGGEVGRKLIISSKQMNLEVNEIARIEALK